MFEDILGDIIEQFESGEITEWCPSCWSSDVMKTHIMRPKQNGRKGEMERKWLCMRCDYEIWC